MTTTYNTKKKLFATAAALAAGATPAVLFAGAGTGHAGPPAPDFNTNGVISVQYTLNPLGLNAVINDTKNPKGVTERCHYHSVGTGLTLPLPFDADAFPQGPDTWGTVFIPAMQLGGTWNVTITCDHGGTFNYNVTY